MRIVRQPEELKNCWKTAKQEAAVAFGDGSIYLEKYIEAPRHIEFQILADHHGHVVHLGERECSIQRRHQKLVEECPSTVLTERQRRKLGRLVTSAAASVGYRNAGTFEFLMDDQGQFFFLEANARLQVEHPVTEMICGLDLVREMVRVAAGAPLLRERRHGLGRAHLHLDKLLVDLLRGLVVQARLLREAQNLAGVEGALGSGATPARGADGHGAEELLELRLHVLHVGRVPLLPLPQPLLLLLHHCAGALSVSQTDFIM